MSTAQIRTTFNTMLDTSGYRIINESDSTNVAGKYPFIRPQLMPAESVIQEANTSRLKVKGLYRVDVVSAKTITPLDDLLTIAEALITLYHRQQITESGTQIIITKSWYDATKYDKGIMTIPVFVRYEGWDIT
jgi:hypothetical protein